MAELLRGSHLGTGAPKRSLGHCDVVADDGMEISIGPGRERIPPVPRAALGGLDELHLFAVETTVSVCIT